MLSILPYRQEVTKDLVLVDVSELALLKASRLLKEKDDENYNFPFRGIRYVSSKKRAYWCELINKIATYAKYEDISSNVIYNTPITKTNSKYFSVNNVYPGEEKKPKKLSLMINENEYHKYCNYHLNAKIYKDVSLCSIPLNEFSKVEHQKLIINFLGINDSFSKFTNFFSARKLTKFLEMIIKKLDAKIYNFIRLKEE